jgi:rfaE bifunctional protein kinase chain/domain
MKMKDKLLRILKSFKGKTILVIGDIMLDKYIWGNVERISPEAPVQVVKVEKENYVPGGAANVANNIVALDGKAIIVGIVGNDQAAKLLLEELKKRNIKTEGIFIDDKKPTIQKVRVIAYKQQLLRIDYEKSEYVEENIENKIVQLVKEKIDEIDAIIISDYAKGVITKKLIEEIKKIDGKKIIVDPKPKHLNFYEGVSLVTPNLKEAKEMTNKEDIKDIGNELLRRLKAPVLITRGEKGMSLFEKEDTTNIPTLAKEVYDVSGAGDTVVATLSLALASGATLKEAATIANHAAGVVVGKIGTATATKEEIGKSIENE